MLGGYQTAAWASLHRRLRRADASLATQATIVGDSRRSTVEGAAFANATMGKFLGMDDSHRTAGHVASQLVGAVPRWRWANPCSLTGEQAYHGAGGGLRCHAHD